MHVNLYNSPKGYISKFVRAGLQMLMQLKNLALEAETELERQDEVLDVLTSSTDRATMRIEKHTCRMKRLL